MVNNTSTVSETQSKDGVTRTEHQIEVARPAPEVYDLLADVRNWPWLFPPTLHLEREDLGDGAEIIQIWATANGVVKTWTSRRDLDSEGSTIRFRQERSQHPVQSMSGTWIVEPLETGGSRVRLLHDYRAVDDDPEHLDWITRAVDTNSEAELAALKRNAEASSAGSGLYLDFSDTVEVSGPASACYGFVNDAGAWKERLGHVAEVRLEELEPGIQTLEMDTIAKDGSTHTTRSHRICFPSERIVYKQTTLPPLMSVHNGEWNFVDDADGVARVTSRHVVLLNPEAITKVLGPDATVETARAYVQDALSTNSLKTLSHAKAWAEGESS